MGPHRDDAELTMDKPIVSISLGCSAVFCIESNPPPSAAPSHVVAMWLRSGDVCIMDGASRNALHAVACVVPDPPRGSAPEEGVLGAYLASHRININTRQVEGDFGHETFAGQALRVKRVKENAGGLLEAACSEV
jgi:alkylated DNA repair protein alkB family protein 1